VTAHTDFGSAASPVLRCDMTRRNGECGMYPCYKAVVQLPNTLLWKYRVVVNKMCLVIFSKSAVGQMGDCHANLGVCSKYQTDSGVVKSKKNKTCWQRSKLFHQAKHTGSRLATTIGAVSQNLLLTGIFFLIKFVCITCWGLLFYSSCAALKIGLRM